MAEKKAKAGAGAKNETIQEAKLETTFAIIKPDAFKAGVSGQILQRIVDHGFRVRGLKMLHLSKAQAEGFYAVHVERPFFKALVKFMTSGPVIVLAIEKVGAVKAWRDLMGPTNSKEAPKGTIRGDFGKDVEKNASHGSDSAANAAIEVGFFFSTSELL